MMRHTSSLISVVRKQCASPPLVPRQYVPRFYATTILSRNPSHTMSKRLYATSSHAMDLELPTPVYTPQPPRPLPTTPPGTTPGTTTPAGTTPGTTPGATAGTTPGTSPPTPGVTPGSTSPPSTFPPTTPPSTSPPETPPPKPASSTAQYAVPPPPIRKKRVKKPEPPPQNPIEVEFNAFKNRLQLARLKGEAGEQEAEKEMETNQTTGLADKNKKAVEVGLMEIYDTLFPLGFHSVWLYKLGKKYSGYEFIAKYLLKNKGKNWVLFVPRRHINLWQECAKDFYTSCNEPLIKEEINVSDVLDVLTVYYIDTLERDKYTFLDDQIEKPVIRNVKDVIKECADTLEQNIALKFYTRMITEHPLIIQHLKPEELRDLLVDVLARLSPENAKTLRTEIKAAEAIRNMVEVSDVNDPNAVITVKPSPPTTPPSTDTPATGDAAAATTPVDTSPQMNPASS